MTNRIDEILGTTTECIMFNAGWNKQVERPEELVELWNDGKDFRVYILNQYTSIRDIELLKQDYDRAYLAQIGLGNIRIW